MPARKEAQRVSRFGRKPGFGKPPEQVRRNRVVVMLDDAEFEALQRAAGRQGLPLGTVAYGFVSRGLQRTK